MPWQLDTKAPEVITGSAGRALLTWEPEGIPPPPSFRQSPGPWARRLLLLQTNGLQGLGQNPDRTPGEEGLDTQPSSSQIQKHSSEGTCDLLTSQAEPPV